MADAAPKRITVYLRNLAGRPHWCVQWVNPATGKEVTRTTRTADEAAARKFAAVLEDRLNRGEAAPGGGPRAGVATWAEFREMYEAERVAGLRPNTRKNTRQALGVFEEMAAPKNVASVTEDTLARFAARMAAEGYAPATAHLHLRKVKAALRWAVLRKVIGVVPYVEMPKVPDAGPPRRLLDEAGYRALRKKLPAPWRVFLDLGWHTGMRVGEMEALSWARAGDDSAPWVDMPLEQVRFPAASSKGGRFDWIPIHPALMRVLRPLRRGSGRVLSMLPCDGRLGAGFAARALAAGYPLKPHDLRRSFATRYAPMVKAGDLQGLMRHGKIATTMRYYVNVDSTLAAAIRKL